MSLHSAVFLDRDGTIIRDTGYVRDPADVALLPGAAEALRALRAQGFRLVIISNQSGIGRGMFTQAELDAVHQRMLDLLAPAGVTFDGVYYCPHAPAEDCRCRKPHPTFLRMAAETLMLDLAQSYMIGDKPSDVETGRRAGCHTVLLADRLPDGLGAERRPDVVLPDLQQAAAWVMRRHQATASRKEEAHVS